MQVRVGNDLLEHSQALGYHTRRRQVFAQSCSRTSAVAITGAPASTEFLFGYLVLVPAVGC